jgi:hypothetical protein
MSVTSLEIVDRALLPHGAPRPGDGVRELQGRLMWSGRRLVRLRREFVHWREETSDREVDHVGQ